jgi:hypothetical protein
MGKRDPKLGGTHGTAHGYHHLSSLTNMVDVGFGGVNHHSGIKMPKIIFDKFFYRLKM